MRMQLAALLTLCFGYSVTALSDAPFATASFEKRIEETGKAIPISSARLDDHVCLVVRDVSTSDGDHSLKLVIYDGSGREVYQSVAPVTATDRKWGRTICYGFNETRDAPGTWWYVAELDELPLVSKELVVSPLH